MRKGWRKSEGTRKSLWIRERKSQGEEVRKEKKQYRMESKGAESVRKNSIGRRVRVWWV